MLERLYLEMKYRHKQLLLDMERVLNSIITDIEVVIQIQNNYVNRFLSNIECPEKKIKPNDYSQVTLSFLFLTLCKYMEFYSKYKRNINKLAKNETPKEIFKKLNQLKIKEYRNKSIGHILDEHTKRPLSLEKHIEFYERIDKEHKSLYAFWLKMDNYHFTEEGPLLTTLKDLLKKITAERKKPL